jgi:hypothetical protein
MHDQSSPIQDDVANRLIWYRLSCTDPQAKVASFTEERKHLWAARMAHWPALADMVVRRQKLLLQNTDCEEHLECRVVTVKKELIGPPTVAVEFTRPAPSFWRIAFPPADWKA